MKNVIFISLISVLAIMGCSKDSSNDDTPKGGNIVFEDDLAKAHFVNMFDLNSDAELSYSEAAAVTGSLSIDITGLKFLDELKYFVAITEIKVFESETLERISIPRNVKSIRDFGTLDHGAIKREFPKLKQIRCYSTEPPKQAERMLMNIHAEYDGDHILYVPKESVSSYKNHIKEYMKTYPFHVFNFEGFTDEEINSVLNRIKGF